MSIKIWHEWICDVCAKRVQGGRKYQIAVNAAVPYPEVPPGWATVFRAGGQHMTPLRIHVCSDACLDGRQRD